MTVSSVAVHPGSGTTQPSSCYPPDETRFVSWLRRNGLHARMSDANLVIMDNRTVQDICSKEADSTKYLRRTGGTKHCG